MANAFETEVSASAKALGLYYRKVAIASTMRRGRTILMTTPSYDGFLIGKDGRHVAVELKSLAVHGSFPLANIADHQFEGLAEVSALGAGSYFLINMRRRQDGKKLVSDNRAWRIDFRDWMDLLNALPPWRGKPRHSIPLEMFEDGRYFNSIPRIHVSVPGKPKPLLCWDLRVLI
jgi:penicillin-binding protein-related factor A (putative recombinase)